MIKKRREREVSKRKTKERGQTKRNIVKVRGKGLREAGGEVGRRRKAGKGEWKCIERNNV